MPKKLNWSQRTRRRNMQTEIQDMQNEEIIQFCETLNKLRWLGNWAPEEALKLAYTELAEREEEKYRRRQQIKKRREIVNQMTSEQQYNLIKERFGRLELPDKY